MKKTVLILLLLFCIFSFRAKAQKDSIPPHQIFFNIGGQTSCFFGDRYIMYDTTISGNLSTSNSFIGYTRMPTSNIFLGISYQYVLKNKYVLILGFLYNNRRYLYKSDSANLSLFKYYLMPNENVYKYDIFKNNFEADLEIGYSYNRFCFNFGTKILIATLERKIKHNLNGNKDIETDKFRTVFGGHYSQQVFYPEIIISYTIKIKKISPTIYFGIDNFIHFYQKGKYNFNVFYGVKIPIVPNIIKIRKR